MADEERLVAPAFGGTISYVTMKKAQGVAEIHEPSPIPANRTVNHWFVPFALFPEGEVYEVSADTTQNLLLVVQHLRDGKTEWDLKVHVRSLSDPSARHPRASAPILYTATSGREFKGIYSIQIHNQYVAWGLWSDPKVVDSRIELWDWQNGLFVWRCDFGPKVSFSLLDSTHIVVAADHWDHLCVYRVSGHIRVTRDILRLDLPFRNRRVRVQESSIPVSPADAPFWSDPALRVILVAYSRKRDGRRSGGIIIPYATFIRWLDRIPVLDGTLSLLEVKCSSGNGQVV
ncbi:hypothetical protein K466DRAFT_606701 [Polyporus arcularius HHB13444]|uniref:Uncharacterized protein n=1 Tax=Polyporus arcularius HHB13444 TaxID=1314778 RepID=A0A5C3NMK3_9APHY|nr:hypothetical protein K466DRAFT_606701 [Polyporus arcularius HHB13444]